LNCGAGDDQFEIGTAWEKQLQVAEQEIDVEAAFVGLVENDAVVTAQVGIGLGFGEENAVGHHFDDGVAAGFVVETDFGTDFATVLNIEFLGETAGDGESGDTARLGDAYKQRASRSAFPFSIEHGVPNPASSLVPRLGCSLRG